jgi:hypothetical protein
MKLEGRAREAAKKLAKLAFPEYKGRKFAAEVAETYYMENYWDGGTCKDVVAVELATGRVHNAKPEVAGPWASHHFEIPANVALVEWAWFCGKDCGITIYLANPRRLEPDTSEALAFMTYEMELPFIDGYLDAKALEAVK